MTRRARLIAPLALLPALGFLAGCGPTALTLTVNSTGDAADASPGDGVCRTAGGLCTLRAAIQESNLSGQKDTIRFGIGTGAKSIVLTNVLPDLLDPVTLDASTQAGFAGTPLIHIDGAIPNSASGQPTLVIRGGNSLVRGFVLDDGAVGVHLTGAGADV